MRRFSALCFVRRTKVTADVASSAFFNTQIRFEKNPGILDSDHWIGSVAASMT